MKQKMTTRQFLRAVFTIAIPVAAQTLLTTTGSMVDTMMLGTVGETSVGAVGLCAQFSSLMLSCYWGLLGGGILFFSQYWGAKDEKRMNHAYGLMLVSMLFVGFVFGIMGAFFPGVVMRIYTDKEVYQEIGIRYLRIVGYAYPLQVWSIAMGGLLRSTEHVRIPLVASIISVFTNVSLNFVLIFGYFGLPQMGVVGAAIATLVSAIVNVCVVLIAARIIRYPYLFQIREHFRWSIAEIKLYYTKCLPIVLDELALGMTTLIINIVLGRQAIEAIAALAVFRTIEGMVISFFTGFSSAASVLVGTRVGSGDHEEAFWIANRCIYLCAATIFTVCVGVVLIRQPLLHAMGLSAGSYRYATQMLLVYCVIAVFRMSNWTSTDTCRASGDSITLTCIEIFSMYVIVIPMICLSGLVFHWPFLIVFICSYCDEPLRFLVTQLHMHSGGWVRPVTDKGRATLGEFRKNHPLKFPLSRIGLKNEQL